MDSGTEAWERLAKRTLRDMYDLKPDERKSFVERLSAVYCRRCGFEHPANGWCQCENED